MQFNSVNKGPEPPPKRAEDKRWLVNYDGREIEIWAKDESEVKFTLCQYGFCNSKKIKSIVEIDRKSPNDIQPVE